MPTGTPIEPASSSSNPTLDSTSRQSDVLNQAVQIEKHINEPMGIVEEVAREYIRLRNELGPRAHVLLDEEALRQQRIKEQQEQDQHERAVFAVQYHKLLNQTSYVQHVWRRMEECGYFDEEDIGDDAESHTDDAGEEEKEVNDYEGIEQSLDDNAANQPPEESMREEAPPPRRSTRKRRPVQ